MITCLGGSVFKPRLVRRCAMWTLAIVLVALLVVIMVCGDADRVAYLDELWERSRADHKM